MNWDQETGHAIDIVTDLLRAVARFGSRIPDIQTTNPFKKS